jgi:hypothetical protein
MRESGIAGNCDINIARVERLDMLDRDSVLVMFSNGQTVVIDSEELKRFALTSGRIVGND